MNKIYEQLNLLNEHTQELTEKVSIRLGHVHMEELTSDNSFEAWLRMRKLDIVLDVPEEKWISMEDIALNIGIKVKFTQFYNKDFDGMLMDFLEDRAIKSEKKNR
jgi:hypothetical protein